MESDHPSREAALGRALERHHARLLERVRLMMGGAARREADSADFTQRTLAAAVKHQHKAPLDDERALLRWLTAIARNQIRDSARRRREESLASLSRELRANPAAEGPTPSHAAGDAEERLALVEALEEMPEDERRVIELRDLEGLAFAEVGEALGRSSEAARKLHQRALLRLGRQLRTQRP